MFSLFVSGISCLLQSLQFRIMANLTSKLFVSNQLYLIEHLVEMMLERIIFSFRNFLINANLLLPLIVVEFIHVPITLTHNLGVLSCIKIYLCSLVIINLRHWLKQLLRPLVKKVFEHNLFTVNHRTVQNLLTFIIISLL